MREVLFRGKRNDNGEMVYGNLFVENGKAFILCEYEISCVDGENTDFYAMEWYEVDPETVCQYTGLTDKNGKKIFEGDIVKTTVGHLVVQWDEKLATWCLSKEGWMFKHFFGEGVVPEYCEAIGNIFDNPDLP